MTSFIWHFKSSSLIWVSVLFFLKSYSMYVNFCLHVYLHAMCMLNVHGGHRVSHIIELKLQGALWMPVTQPPNPGPLEEFSMLLSTERLFSPSFIVLCVHWCLLYDSAMTGCELLTKWWILCVLATFPVSLIRWILSILATFLLLYKIPKQKQLEGEWAGLFGLQFITTGNSWRQESQREVSHIASAIKKQRDECMSSTSLSFSCLPGL